MPLVASSITHRSVRVLKIDASRLEPEDFDSDTERIEPLIMAAPRRSLRVLLILTNRVSPEASDALRRRMLAHGEHILATAVVGTAFWNVVVAGIRARGRDNVELFSNESAALDWLVSR